MAKSRKKAQAHAGHPRSGPGGPKANKRSTPAGQAAQPARTGSKQAKLIAMLRTPAGATIAQIAKAFEWQPHTVRGVLSGALKRKLGLVIKSSKSEGGERVYRIG